VPPMLLDQLAHPLLRAHQGRDRRLPRRVTTMDIATTLADRIIVGLPKGAFGHANFRAQLWAEALNRAQRRTGKPCRVRYSRASSGHYDVDGCFRPFGGAMIFSAWCDCGQFTYHGEEDLRRYAVKAHKAWIALTVNDVVRLHWSRDEWDGREFVIIATDGHRLTLEDVDWGDKRLVVDRAQVDPAGRRWVKVSCGHPRYTRRARDGRCMTYGCEPTH
jgi:hypothetical protein